MSAAQVEPTISAGDATEARRLDSLQRYRRRYRDAHIGRHYSGPAHLAFTTCASLAVIAAFIAACDGLRWLELLAVPATFVYANIGEYLGHRGPMHNRTRFLAAIHRRHAVQHHRFFTDSAMAFDTRQDYKAVLLPPVLFVFFAGVFVLPVWALLAFLTTGNTAHLFAATSVAYFLNYELLHFAYHQDPDSRIGRLPFMARLRRLHTRHHDPALMNRFNFNVTYPIGDWLFGTLYRGK